MSWDLFAGLIVGSGSMLACTVPTVVAQRVLASVRRSRRGEDVDLFNDDRAPLRPVTPLTLPRLAGGRDRARRLTRGLPLAGGIVTMDCRDLLSSPPSFADELVRIILGQRGASMLRVFGAGTEFAVHLTEAATIHDVADRLKID